ncbi:MAG: hypothetical protein V8Q84_06500 [Bilophila sp.]
MTTSQKMFFQLIHAQHLAGRCTGCGECNGPARWASRCSPSSSRFGRMVKKLFGYAAGMDVTPCRRCSAYQLEEPNIKGA